MVKKIVALCMALVMIFSLCSVVAEAKNSSTVTFDANGGTIVGEGNKTEIEVTTENNGRITNFPVATRTNYLFMGWYMDITNVNTQVLAGSTKFDDGVKVYASWTDNTPTLPPSTGAYTLTAENDGHGTVSVTPSGKFNGGDVATLTAIPNNGYVFDKWESEEVTIDPDVATASTLVITMPATDTTIKATFKTAPVAPHTHVWDVALENTNTNIAIRKCTIPGCTDEDKAYLGVHVNNNKLEGTLKDALGNDVLASWTNYQVLFSDVQAPVDGNQTSKNGKQYAVLCYKWNSKTERRVVAVMDTLAETYLVCYMVNGEQWKVESGVSSGNTLTNIGTPTNIDGYRFDGWFKEAACQNPWDFETDVMPNETLFLYAKLTPLYTVTFDADGGTPAPTLQTVAQGEKVTAPATPTKNGYIFGGWEDITNNRIWDFNAYPVTTDTTLTARWVQAEVVDKATGTSVLDASGNVAANFSISGGANALLTDADKAAIASGKSVEFKLTINTASKTDVQADLDIYASDTKLYAVYGEHYVPLDIDLTKTTYNFDKTVSGTDLVTDTDVNISISVEIPEELRTTATDIVREYAVIRIHDGKAEKLLTTKSGNTLTFSTSKFSTYAIAYVDQSRGHHYHEPVPSAKTGDAGVALYVGMSLAAVLGSAVVIGRKKEF